MEKDFFGAVPKGGKQEMDNYTIKETDKDNYFRGWDRYGDIKMAPEKAYAYRMSRTLAGRTLEKVVKATGLHCEVCKTC